MEIKTRKVYKNISKVKGRLVSVVDWKILLYINGDKLDDGEVFVLDQFFESLLNPGIYPLFTCTCGIFGCGGYYVEVIHEAESMIWLTEQSPFEDRTFKSLNKFIFSWDQILEFSDELIEKLEELKNVMSASESEFNMDTEKYRGLVTGIKHKRKGE